MNRKVAVISGANGGIGSAITARLLQEGWIVYGICTRDPSTYPPIPHTGDGTLSLVQCRVEKASQVKTLRQNVGMRVGYCDLLVVAHGAAPCVKSMEKLSPAEFKHIIDVDVLGAFYLTRNFGPMMLRRSQGSIVLLTSIHQQGTFPNRVPYSTAKTAIVGLGRALAVEWAPHVQVNMIAPGHVDGPRTRALADPATLHDMLTRTPALQLVQPGDIAETVLWLLRTPSMTGQVVTIDHGWTASLWYRPYPVEDVHEQ